MSDDKLERTERALDFSGIQAPEELLRMKRATPARIGIGHVGARYKTAAALRFGADHAAANDAAFSEVPEDIPARLGFFSVQTLCRDKAEMITRPDLGRYFDEEQKARILSSCRYAPDVQIYCGDGLCAPSIAANIPDLYPAIRDELVFRGISVGTPFFVRYCRVNTARVIGPLLNAEVVCVLIGERPGLLTSESMSAYIAYRPHPDMQENAYTVVSNISRFGTPPVEAAAYIASLIGEILEKKKSGLSLKQNEE